MCLLIVRRFRLVRRSKEIIHLKLICFMIKFIFLAIPFLALFIVTDADEAGYGYGGYRSFGGYSSGFGHGYRSSGYGLSSRYRSPAFHYYNGGRGHFRDSGHSNYRTYRIYRNHDKKFVPSARAISKNSKSGRSIFKRIVTR